MLHLLLISLVALFDHFTYQPTTQDTSNPLLPGWYSDPNICKNDDGDYFLVTSTFGYFPGVPLFHSRDLVHWQQIGHVLNRESQLLNMENQPITYGGIYAPAIRYNPANKTYYMITTNVGYGNFFVKTTDPFAGEWSDPIFLPEVHGIDPSFLFDTDGKAYIVHNDSAPNNEPEYNGHCTIRMYEFDVNTDKVVGEEYILLNKGTKPENKPIWIEGPHLYHIDDYYYLMAAEGGTGTQHSEVLLRAESPYGPFEPWENRPILPPRTLGERPNPITCTGHADIIQAFDGKWWAVFLACRPLNNDFENLGRETFMMPLQWTDDKWFFMTQGTDTVPAEISAAHSPMYNGIVMDEFDNEELQQEWLTLRSAASDCYSLSENKGFLTLKANGKKVSERGTPAYVGRRMQHHEFTASTTMFFTPSNDGEAAGMLLYKDETHFYFMALTQIDNQRVMQLRKGNEVLATQPLGKKKSRRIELQVISRGTSYDFLYSTDKGKTWSTLASNIDARYLSTANAEGFTGTTIGMYCER